MDAQERTKKGMDTQTASIRDRFLAFLIDIILIFISVFAQIITIVAAMSLFVWLVIVIYETNVFWLVLLLQYSLKTVSFILLFLTITSVFLYFIVVGQTPGMILRHIKPVDSAEEKPDFSSILIRCALLPLDLFLSWIGLIQHLRNRPYRSLGERATKSMMIKLPHSSCDTFVSSKKPVKKRDRLLAYFADKIILSVGNLLVWPIILTHVKISAFWICIIVLISYFFYDLIFEIIMKGQTPGKRLCGVAIIKSDGSQPQFVHFLLRWVSRPLGLIVIPSRFRDAHAVFPRHQLSELFSGTTLVKREKILPTQALEKPAKDLPEAPEGLLQSITEASKNARSIYLIFNSVLAFCALTALGTSDRQMILNESTKLPLLNIDVSLDGFFVLAAIILIIVFIYFQLYLSKLKRLIFELRNEYQKLNESYALYPWLLNFVSEINTGFVGRLQRYIAYLSVWFSLPTVLVLLSLIYIKKHDLILCSIVGLMPLVGTLLVIGFWRHSQNFEKNSGTNGAQPTRQKVIRYTRQLLMLTLLFEIYFFAVFMPSAYRGERLFYNWPAVDLSFQKLIVKEGKEFRTLYWGNLFNVQLQGANLRGAILEKADIRNANLRGATLLEAQLQGTDLSGTNLRGANLSKADLRGANFRSAKMEKALLAGALMDENTDFRGTLLTGVEIDPAQLETIRVLKKVFRSTAVTKPLTDKDCKKIVVDKGFYDTYGNPSAKGVVNDFKRQEDNKITIDFATGLMWQSTGSGGIVMPINDAKKYIKGLNKKEYAGFTDWRLPTLEEAMTLMETEQNSYGLFIDSQITTSTRRIWTCDLNSRHRFGGTVVVYFDKGSCLSGNFVGSNGGVIAVR